MESGKNNSSAQHNKIGLVSEFKPTSMFTLNTDRTDLTENNNDEDNNDDLLNDDDIRKITRL